MAVYRRGKVYWYSFWFNGERKQGSTKATNQKSAKSIEAKLKTDLALGLYGLAPVKPGPPLEKYADKFREFIATRNAQHPETISFYREKLDRLLEYKPLAECRINLIDESLIEEYVQHRRSSKAVKAVATINRELATLRRIMRVACNVHKLIHRVPVITLIPGEASRETVISYDEEKLYLAVAEDDLRDFAVLSLDTGVRAGEGVSLEWDDVHFEAAPNAKLGYIRIRERGSKKRGRVLSMSPRLRKALENRREFLPEATYVFESSRKKDAHLLVSSLDHMHVRAVKAAKTLVEAKGLEVRLPAGLVIHSFRHTFGTRLGESGADAFTIMRLMGHSSVTVSQKYVHPTPESLERAFERLEALNQIMRGDAEAAERLGVSTESTTSKKRRP